MVCPILVVNANSRKIRLLKEGVVQSQEKDFPCDHGMNHGTR